MGQWGTITDTLATQMTFEQRSEGHGTAHRADICLGRELSKRRDCRTVSLRQGLEKQAGGGHVAGGKWRTGGPSWRTVLAFRGHWRVSGLTSVSDMERACWPRSSPGP